MTTAVRSRMTNRREAASKKRGSRMNELKDDEDNYDLGFNLQL